MRVCLFLERERRHTLGSLGTLPDIGVFNGHMLKLLSRRSCSRSTTIEQYSAVKLSNMTTFTNPLT